MPEALSCGKLSSMITRRQRTSSDRLREDLLDRVCKTDSCWIWRGTRHCQGYGSFGYKGKSMLAHRLMWEVLKGPIPKGMFLLHKCDTPLCVNPDHLFLGTQLDNMRDSRRKDRMCRGDRHPCHKLTDSDIAEIRLRLSQGETRTSLRLEFKISQPYMSRLARGVRR
jgi:hypothetical protein